MIGNSPYFFATSSSDCDFSRCCHSGVRLPGRARGISSARPAFSRKRAPNSALEDSSLTTRSSSSSGSISTSSAPGRLLGVGEVDDDPVVGPDRVGLEAELVADPGADSASPQAAWTRPPNGLRMHSRQSPISSRKRSITIA